MQVALTIKIEKTVEALRQALTVMTAETIGTYRMDDPDWYCALNKAVASARAALAAPQSAPTAEPAPEPTIDGWPLWSCLPPPAAPKAADCERGAFEAWAATALLDLKPLYAGYFHETTAFAWLAWQARAAVKERAAT
jgi:hypothetical protein